MTFSFDIYDCHEQQAFCEDGSFIATPFDWWYKFELTLVLTDTWITSFRKYTLFDNDKNPKECTRVYLSDGSVVFAASKYKDFKVNFNDNYLPLFKSIHAPIQNEIAN